MNTNMNKYEHGSIKATHEGRAYETVFEGKGEESLVRIRLNEVHSRRTDQRALISRQSSWTGQRQCLGQPVIYLYSAFLLLPFPHQMAWHFLATIFGSQMIRGVRSRQREKVFISSSKWQSSAIMTRITFYGVYEAFGVVEATEPCSGRGSSKISKFSLGFEKSIICHFKSRDQ